MHTYAHVYIKVVNLNSSASARAAKTPFCPKQTNVNLSTPLNSNNNNNRLNNNQRASTTAAAKLVAAGGEATYLFLGAVDGLP